MKTIKIRPYSIHICFSISISFASSSSSVIGLKKANKIFLGINKNVLNEVVKNSNFYPSSLLFSAASSISQKQLKTMQIDPNKNVYRFLFNTKAPNEASATSIGFLEILGKILTTNRGTPKLYNFFFSIGSLLNFEKYVKDKNFYFVCFSNCFGVCLFPTLSLPFFKTFGLFAYWCETDKLNKNPKNEKLNVLDTFSPLRPFSYFPFYIMQINFLPYKFFSSNTKPILQNSK